MATRKARKAREVREALVPNRQVWEVWLDAPELGPAALVGRLYQNLAKTAVPASFTYEPAWLQGQTKFMLDPRLELYAGEQNPLADFPAFGIFMDSAPDRWGRMLMERRELLKAEQEGRVPRTLHETDFLLGVSDAVRMGALRFRLTEGSPYVSDDELAAPPRHEPRRATWTWRKPSRTSAHATTSKRTCTNSFGGRCSTCSSATATTTCATTGSCATPRAGACRQPSTSTPTRPSTSTA